MGNWKQVADYYLRQKRNTSIVTFNNKLYVGTYSKAYLFEWNGTDAFIKVANKPSTPSGYPAIRAIVGLVVFNDKLYGVTCNGGHLFEWNGTDAWVLKAVGTSLLSGLNPTTNALVVFNDKI